MIEQRWAVITVTAPEDDVFQLVAQLQREGYADADWCELDRPDGARAVYGPAWKPMDRE